MNPKLTIMPDMEGGRELKDAWMGTVRRRTSPTEQLTPWAESPWYGSGYVPGGQLRFQRSDSNLILQSPPLDTENHLVELGRIHRHLKETSGGVILWIKLVLQQLQEAIESEAGFSLLDLREMAESLPPEIEELCIRILEKLELHKNEKKLRVSKRILLWALASQSSHPLELQDLWDAIAIPEADDVLGTTDDPIELRRFMISGNWDAFRRIIYAHCGPLVEIIPKEVSAIRVSPLQATATIQLVHQTAKTFLEDPARSGTLHLRHQDAVDFAKFESLKYLRLVLPPEGTFYAPIIRPDRVDKEIFLLVNYLNSRPFIRWALRLTDSAVSSDWIQAIKTSIPSEGQVDITEMTFPLWWLCSGTNLDFANVKLALPICKLACVLGKSVALQVICDFLDVYAETATGLPSNKITDYEVMMARGAADAYCEYLDKNIDCSSPIIDELIKILRNGLSEIEFEELAAKIKKKKKKKKFKVRSPEYDVGIRTFPSR
ncbi:hypothetical protein E0Z10_g3117 [Xylaria hypoxylon]|uniref:Uncharacterized protein n=1 Tax=Xylaria hypoxylon TaxID=37992 RepID=A0A4Z0YPH2_9PEZI|nr:hypothetical protein E0Z10_g3117 [Xylaria hypoxylon]